MLIKTKNMLHIIKHITDLAMKISTANLIGPQIIQCCISLQLLIECKVAGQTPKGSQMPQTPEEFQYMGDLYEEALLEAHAENSKLRNKINSLSQRLERQRLSLTDLIKNPDEN